MPTMMRRKKSVGLIVFDRPVIRSDRRTVVELPEDDGEEEEEYAVPSSLTQISGERIAISSSSR
jgi:hypothetical protein